MFNWRNRLTPALAAVAAFVLLVALFFRPHSLPPTAAQYKIAAPRFAAKTTRKATPGITFAIDSIESDHVQHPITGAIISTREPLTLHGWAVAPDTLTPGQALLVSVDGRPGVPDSTYGLARPDVGAIINPAATRSGFASVVNLQGLKPGPHTIRLQLKDAAGRPLDLPSVVSFTLR